MNDKVRTASEDAHKQFHNTEHKIMPKTMNKNLNDGQRAAIVAALRESVISGAEVNASCSKVINQMVDVNTTLDLFSGQGDVSTTTKQKKLTPKFLHEMEYLYLENESLGKEASILPLEDVFYKWVPSFFTQLLSEQGDNRYQRDATFLGLLALLSVLFPHCFIVDRGQEYSLGLMCFISGLTGDGKGGATKYRVLLESLNKYLMEKRKKAENRYDKEMELYKQRKEDLKKQCKYDGKSESAEAERQFMELEEPVMPIFPVVLGPEETTLPNMVTDLVENGEYVFLQVAEEMSIVVQSNGREHGGFFKLYLKSFHEEPFGKGIKTGREKQYIPRTRLSVLGTMTHEQMRELLSTLDTGLPSRCIIFTMPEEYSEYIPEEYGSEAMEKRREMIASLQEIVMNLYLTLERKVATEKEDEKKKFVLTFTREQHNQVNRFGEVIENHIKAKYDDRDGLVSIARRSCTIAKRLLFILLAFRRYDELGSWDAVFDSKQLVPTDSDVDHVLYLTHHLCESNINALHYFNILKSHDDEQAKSTRLRKGEILKSMKNRFTWEELRHLACDIHGYAERNISDDRWIKKWIEGGFIAVENGEGRERTFRKLSVRERKAFTKKSKEAKQRIVKKQVKRK